MIMNRYIKQGKIFSVGLMTSLLVFSACTNLEVDEKDSYLRGTTGGFTPLTPEGVTATLQSAYSDIRDNWGNQENMYALQEVSSDELLVPTRGTDWGDNGVWRSLRQHTWDGTHRDVLGSWNILNRNVYKLNTVIASTDAANAAQIAEAKFLRAFNMWHVLDFFRQIPIREVTDGVDVDPKVLDATQGFDFIVKDLTDALPALPAVGTGGDRKRATQAAAHFLLAKMYLNKHVYLGAAVQPADMTRVIEHVDAIKAAGFALNNGYFDIFKNANNSETIFWTDASSGNRIWAGLHYFQRTYDKFKDDPFGENTGGGWNGFSTTAEFYALFEGDANSNEPGSGQEERRGYVPRSTDWYHAGIGYGFLVGQQYDSAGNAMKDRPGNPLVYTKEFASASSLTGNNERQGIRVIKYHPSEGQANAYYVLFRYADAHLMKIEAMLRGGTSTDDALTLYNQLRTIRKATPAGVVTLNDILAERGRELYIEGWRRNDQVRFGTFTQPFPFMENPEEHRNVFPIPANALSSNPNLKPTPGYGDE
jgi:starch-binding outer membrane protein, SusD/RagB family